MQRRNSIQHPFNGGNGPLSGTTRVSRYQKGKINLDLLQQEIVSGSGISWAMCKSAPRPDRPNHANTQPLSFLQAADALLAAQSTASKRSLFFHRAVHCMLQLRDAAARSNVMFGLYRKLLTFVAKY